MHTLPNSAASRPALERYPLLDALLARRSRRFGKGFALDGGPLSYASEQLAEPLSMDDEAALVFAASGVTGYALGDLPYAPGADPESTGGNIMINLVARSVPSGDALHANTLFVLNDDCAWLIRRPQDYPRTDIAGLVALAHERRFGELYERARIRVSDTRPSVPQEFPYTQTFNLWSVNRPGTSYFLPIAELSAFYINVMLAAFSEPLCGFIVDERNGFRPAGIGKFRRSKGGLLNDDPASGKVGTINSLETWLLEFAAIEQGAMLQNLGLMAAALGLGGFPHFAAHPYGWPLALGFRSQDLRFSKVMGMSPLLRAAARAAKRDLPIPTPLGLERDGQTLIQPYCPPYYPNMRAAVLAFVEYKYRHGSGVFRDGGAATAWKDPATVQAGIPAYSDSAIEATIAYLEYVHGRYGRIPAVSGPFRTVLAYQAHRVEEAFYERYYR
jgi:hypothetical protein